MRIIKVVFEIGHTSHQKNKKSPDGFTHDWELFVRGTDGNNINRFVDKVVFNLHESFPKPCRVHKEPPYVLKESGYASFNLPIDIYLKAGPRDDPKKHSVTYDLDIYKTIVTKHQIIIQNPSTEFRNRLLDGGGIPVNDGHLDDRMNSQQPDSTTKPRPQSSSGGVSGGSSGSSKKHKIKTDEIKPTSTFENLFGSPIMNSKNSPDPKLSNNTNSNSSSGKVPIPRKNPSQKSSKERSSEKSSKEKRDKKDKSGSTPKEGSKESSSKVKSEDKHERREEKRKEKSTIKDRERSKEKSSKRPPSPKPASRSPKRSASPPRASSSNSNRHESIHLKYDEKSSSLVKKSKKEKRDKSKERERSGDKNKETKHQMHAAAAAAAVAAANKQKEEKSSSKSMEKLNGSSKKDENDVKDRDKSNKYRSFDTKPPSPLDVLPAKISTPTDAKKSHDKDERKHKHKKKDKNKDKDRKKSKSKEISDESPLSTSSSNRKHSNVPTPTAQSNRLSNTKSNAMAATMPPQSNQLSDKSSSELDDDDYMDRTSPHKPDKVSSSNDTNQLMEHHLIDPITEMVTPRAIVDSPKKHGTEKSSGKKNKEPKSNQSSASKEEKKKKRKSKSDKQKHDDSGSSGGKRKIQSPIGDEPPTKFYKKDDEKMPKIKDEILHESTKLLPGRTPPVSHLGASPSTQKLYHQSPDSSKLLKRSAESLISNQSSKIIAHRSPSTTSSSPTTSDGEISPRPQPPPPPPPSNPPQAESPGEKYIAQLRALQQKIMTLQDNDELQQVVEMIAETGRYEITNRTFDFDLCALDRTTVQRLQERLG